MLRTRLMRTFDMSSPIVCSGLPSGDGPALAAAISNAGGLGFLPVDLMPARNIAQAIEVTRSLTACSFGVSCAAAYVTNRQLDACIARHPAVIAFAHSQPTRDLIDRFHEAQMAVWCEANSPAAARRALGAGADAIIVHGENATYDANLSLVELLPPIIEAVAPVPVLGASDMTDGRTLAAALVLGAEAVWCLNPFLGCREAHPRPARISGGDHWRQRTMPWDYRDAVGTSGRPQLPKWLGSERTPSSAPASRFRLHSTLNPHDPDSECELWRRVPTPDAMRAALIESRMGGCDARSTRRQKSVADIVRDMSSDAEMALNMLLSVALDAPR